MHNIKDLLIILLFVGLGFCWAHMGEKLGWFFEHRFPRNRQLGTIWFIIYLLSFCFNPFVIMGLILFDEYVHG